MDDGMMKCARCVLIRGANMHRLIHTNALNASARDLRLTPKKANHKSLAPSPFRGSCEGQVDG
jgi:hypothetical protein